MPEGLPDLPTVFRPVIALREGGDAMARAVALAPREGAGTLVWVRAYGRVEAALVLEPEVALATARLAWLVGVASLADACAALGPPELPMSIAWPAVFKVNGAAVGRAFCAAPAGVAEDSVPDWLVVGVTADFCGPEEAEPGLDPGRTTLAEEGFEASPAEITAAWARHLMANLADWQGRGFAALAARYQPRLEAGRLGQAGDLLLEQDGVLIRRALRDAVA